MCNRGRRPILVALHFIGDPTPYLHLAFPPCCVYGRHASHDQLLIDCMFWGPIEQVASLLFRKPPEFEEALALCDIEGDPVTERRIRKLRIVHGYDRFAEVRAYLWLCALWYHVLHGRRFGVCVCLLPCCIVLCERRSLACVSPPLSSTPCSAFGT